jgi:hypothetical protein
MLPNFTQDTNIPLPSSGVHNEFASAITSGDAPKKDTIKILLIVMLVVTILLAVGAFLYTGILSTQINNKRAKLISYDQSNDVIYFEKNLTDIRSLSQKLKLLNGVYDNKLYISGMLFPILESIVESNSDSYVYFNKFNLKKENNAPLAAVSLSGVAKDYVSLYRQIDNFKTGPLSKNFSNFKLLSLSLDQTGNVLFDISFSMDISTKVFLDYVEASLNILDGNSTSSSRGLKSGPLYKSQVPANVVPLAPTSTATTSAYVN